MQTISKLAALAALLLAVAACGGGSTAAPSTAANASAAQSAAAPSTAGGGASATPAPSTAASNPPASIGAVDPCSLFTQADIKAALGKDYGAGVPDAYGQCTWLAGTATVNNGSGQIVATVQANALDFIKTSFSGGVDLTVSGHAAYWNPTSGLQSLWVDVSGSVLVLSFDPVGADTQAAAQKLAEIALTHL